MQTIRVPIRPPTSLHLFRKSSPGHYRLAGRGPHASAPNPALACAQIGAA